MALVPGPCPAWCERDHADIYGVQHRAEIGRVEIRDEKLYVIVVQLLDRPASVMLSGSPIILDIDEDQTDDMRAVVTLLGWPFLAQLIERAAFIVERFNGAARQRKAREESMGS